MEARKGILANTADVKDTTRPFSVSSKNVNVSYVLCLSNAFLHQTVGIRGHALSSAPPLCLGCERHSIISVVSVPLPRDNGHQLSCVLAASPLHSGLSLTLRLVGLSDCHQLPCPCDHSLHPKTSSDCVARVS